MKYDLTHEQIICLEELKRQDGLELGELAKHIDRERTTVTRMIDGLEKRNLVVRVADRGDKRNRLVYLTQLGKKRVQELGPIVLEFYDKLLHGTSESHLDVTLKTLRTIIKNAESE
jgi:DNA-binding MarR family transcriptional regulator